MRANRRNSALSLAVIGPAVVWCSAHAADASKPAAPPPDVPWDTIEAWASGGPMPDANRAAETKKPAPKPDKTEPAKAPQTPQPAAPPPAEVKPAWTPSHLGEHRPEPPQIAQYHVLFLRRAEITAERAEKSKDFERAYAVYYAMEHYPQALAELYAMKMDPKHFGDKDNWILEKWFDTGCIMLPQMPHQELEARFHQWKEQRLAKMKEEEGKPGFDKNSWTWEITEREKMLNEKPTLAESLIKHEQQGEADPNLLWETCNRYNADKPHDPLRFMSTLYKMREWYPEHEAVKSGEVQWRLVNVLCNDLELHKEGADEAVLMQAKFPRNPNVTNGETLWFAAENRRMQSDENHPKREQIELWKDAKRLYEQFKQNYPENSKNQINTPNDKKSECQGHIDDLRDRIR